MTDYGKPVVALKITDVPIDEHCIGDRWVVENIDQLAKLVAIIVMGQATHAARIVSELMLAAPAFTHENLQNEAIIKLTVQDKKRNPEQATHDGKETASYLKQYLGLQLVSVMVPLRILKILTLAPHHRVLTVS